MSDMFVYSAIPPDSEDLIAKYGLLSAVEVAKRPDVLKRARPDKASRSGFRKRVKKALKSPRPDYSMLGPSTLFSVPDPAKITDKHLIKEWGLIPVRINLSQLLQDFPETYVWGAELLPFNRAWRNMSDEEVDADIASMGFASWEDYLQARSHELSDAEIEAYSVMTPQELWEHYDVADAGKKYASNVPHAFIITPSGAIPSEYIEYLNHSRSNPYDAVDFLTDLCELEPYEVEEYMEDNYPHSVTSPEKFLQDHPQPPYKHYHSKDFTWIGSKGRMLRIRPSDVDRVHPIEGNIFDTYKLCAIVDAPSVYDFKIPFMCGYCEVYEMGCDLVLSAMSEEYDVAFYDADADDVGEVFIQLRDGNHRTIGALASDNDAYVFISDNQFQSYQEWIARGKPRSAVYEWLDDNLI